MLWEGVMRGYDIGGGVLRDVVLWERGWYERMSHERVWCVYDARRDCFTRVGVLVVLCCVVLCVGRPIDHLASTGRLCPTTTPLVTIIGCGECIMRGCVGLSIDHLASTGRLCPTTLAPATPTPTKTPGTYYHRGCLCPWWRSVVRHLARLTGWRFCFLACLWKQRYPMVHRAPNWGVSGINRVS